MWNVIVPAVATALGSMYSSRSAESGQSSANAANRQNALAEMQFQRWMAKNAHQMEVQDLRKAGLNPILSGTGGGGAQASGGAMAHAESEKGAGVSSALEALSKITDAFLTREQTEQTKAQTDQTKAQTKLTDASTATELERPALVREDVAYRNQSTSTAQAQERNLRADTLLKKVGHMVALTEIDKNKALTRLFDSQGLTQAQQARLLSLNADQAVEELKGLRNDGAINESTYGKALRYIDRGLETANKVPVLGRFAPSSSRSTRSR